MVSGRLVGISVSPFPRQSTMLLLQVHSSGHCSTLQDECDWGPKTHIQRDDRDAGDVLHKGRLSLKVELNKKQPKKLSQAKKL